MDNLCTKDKLQELANELSGCPKEANDILSTNGLHNRNSYGMIVWDTRFMKVKYVFSNSEGYLTYNDIKIANWTTTVIFNINTGAAGVLVSKQNFENIKKKYKKKGVHYIINILSKNKHFNNSRNEQLSFFDDESYNSEREQLAEKQFKEFYSEIKEVYIITLEEKRGILKLICKKIDSNFVTLKEEVVYSNNKDQLLEMHEVNGELEAEVDEKPEITLKKNLKIKED